MIIFGIDPGFSGGWGAIDETGAYVGCGDMLHTGDFLHFNQILKAMNEHKDEDRMVIVEAVHAMPKQGVSSSFKFGMAYGIALALAQCIGPWSVVAPNIWKRDLELTSDKNDSLAMARLLWPDAPLARKKDNGRAEALLMAEWKRRTL